MSKKPSQNAIGRALGLSSAAMVKLKKQGMPVDSVESAQAWRMARQNVAARKPLPEPAPAFHTVPVNPFEERGKRWDVPEFGGGDETDEARDQARTRREIAEANIAEMTEARLRRELIRVAAVQAQMGVDYATTREALMQIPARLSPLLASQSDAAKIQGLLEGEIHTALVQLASAPDALPRLQGAFD